MRYYNIFDRTSKDEVADLEYNRKSAGGKYFKIVNTISILGIFIALGLVVLGAFNLLQFSAPTFGIIGTISCVCIGSWLMLPWVACWEQKKRKKAAVTFIVLDIAVSLLWIFVTWFLVAKSQSIDSGTLNFVKIVVVITFQFAAVSIIANTILRFGKRLIVVQVILYASFLYFDFFISFALACIKFTEEDGIVTSGMLEILGNKVMLSLFVLSLLYVIISLSIINGGHKRRRTIGDRAADLTGSQHLYEDEQPPKQSTEEQLLSLQNLLNKGLISHAEYEKKRSEILGKI